MNPHMSSPSKGGAAENAFQSSTFKLDMSIKVDAPVGAMSISPSSRDVVLASKQGLHIVDLDNPYDPPRFLQHLTAWSVADVQWSPHASHSHWVVSTSNQKAIVWNLALPSSKAIEHVLQSHTRAITDINFSAHDPNVLATCSVDSFVHCWDLRTPRRPAMSFADWFAGATQVKYNRQNPHILASAHDRYVYIWDTRMGARALKKINAHSTKIYGLDWNRTRPTGIITCALDKSVRFWDYEYAIGDTPERIINTSFPVWRARHTPFGWGVLTMPQRGDTSLYLWDRRRHKDATEEIPVHRFEGHTDNVKEFVWRWRGGERDDVDDREFQLVTWGLDKDIRLWDVDKELMAKIGHDTSKKIRFRITRKGAKYISYRNEEKLAKMAEQEQKLKDHSKMPPPKLTLTVDGARIRKDGLFAGQKGAIGHQLSQANTNGNGKNDDDRRFERLLSGAREGGFMRVGRRKRIDINPITWMKGVKMVRKLPDAEPAIPEGGDGKIATRSNNFTLSWDAPENLGDEVSYVGSKFRYITFEKVNIAARTCTVSLFGPWGANENRIFVRTEISFPPDYPTDGQSIPEFKIEKTSNISDENIDKIDEDLNKIASALVAKRRVCLEACLCYLLGERHDNPHSDEDPDSSDDEEIVNTMAIGDEEEGLNSLINSSKQASVPLPKTCGAVWAPNGQLVCFFPPKEDRLGSKNVLSSLRETERGFRNGGRLWEGFGRLFMPSPTKDYDGDHDDDSDSSFSSDEDSDDETNVRNIGPLRTGFGWGRIAGNSSIARGLRRNGSTDRSTQRSTGTGVRTTTTVTIKKRSVVSLHDMAHVLPSKFELARDYQIGEGSAVCEFNATICEKYGYRDLADVWRLLEMILRDDVPLEVYDAGKKLGTGTESWEDPILVMARRASLEVGRRDSGLALDFDDEDEFFGSDRLKGRVQWGGHPLGGSWFVERLFEYFEKQSDVQMLAMLSCVLSETDKPRKSDLLIGSHTHLQGIVSTP
jgi:WD40 repeat protein